MGVNQRLRWQRSASLVIVLIAATVLAACVSVREAGDQPAPER